MRPRAARAGFTLVELIVIIVVLAILAGVGIPVYMDHTVKARRAAIAGVLGGVRSAIGHFYLAQDVAGTPRYPTLVELQTTGVVLNEPMAVNPATGKSTVGAATYSAASPPVDETIGWYYDASAGRFWSSSATYGSNTW
jgi:prepilin-type N-terminal cleavage/methylation domain-containing protein